MTLKIKEIFCCNLCQAEYDPFEQEVQAYHAHQIRPRENWSQLVYNGMAYDLCPMCMAPVHVAFLEQARKIKEERGLG